MTLLVSIEQDNLVEVNGVKHTLRNPGADAHPVNGLYRSLDFELVPIDGGETIYIQFPENLVTANSSLEPLLMLLSN